MLSVCLKPVFLIVILFVYGVRVTCAQSILVQSSEQLEKAFWQAKAGDKIILLPGKYNVYRLDTHNAGTVDFPITVEAQYKNMAIILATGSEAISVHHPYWVFRGLVMNGSRGSDHAFHVSGNSDGVVIQGNSLANFHSHIKVNGSGGDFPDRGLIENNDIFNTEVRTTSEPVTSIDIVGGDEWVVRNNYISDFSKGGSDKISYGVFIKGNSKNGLIERNLIICEKEFNGGQRVGVSLGGGGTGEEFCKDKHCAVEHSGGVIRNNIILSCSDVGIYLNKAYDTVIENNTILLTMGIDVRFPETVAKVKYNILTGSVRKRSGSFIIEEANLYFGTSLGMWLPSVGRVIKDWLNDFNLNNSSVISDDFLIEANDLVDLFISSVEKTQLGLGQSRTFECFPWLAVLNIKPDEEKCGVFWETKKWSNIEGDFWGNSRENGKNILGAINFYKSSCNLMHRISRGDARSFEVCLNVIDR